MLSFSLLFSSHVFDLSSKKIWLVPDNDKFALKGKNSIISKKSANIKCHDYFEFSFILFRFLVKESLVSS